MLICALKTSNNWPKKATKNPTKKNKINPPQTFSTTYHAERGKNGSCVGVVTSMLRAMQNIYSESWVSKQICFLKMCQSVWTCQVSLSQV